MPFKLKTWSSFYSLLKIKGFESFKGGRIMKKYYKIRLFFLVGFIAVLMSLPHLSYAKVSIYVNWNPFGRAVYPSPVVVPSCASGIVCNSGCSSYVAPSYYSPSYYPSSYNPTGYYTHRYHPSRYDPYVPSSGYRVPAYRPYSKANQNVPTPRIYQGRYR